MSTSGITGSGPATANQPSIDRKLHLTDRQLHALKACSKGISLRFEDYDVVNALLEAGFATKNVAGVILVTVQGRRYLQSQGD